MELTHQQRNAVEHGEGNLQLIACAGSGKTEVVARRVVHLLDPAGDHKLKPANIIAFTPFPVRGYRRIAVKVVDVYGNESTVVRELPDRR